MVYAQVDANQLSNAAKTINDVVDVQMAPRLTDLAKADVSFKALYEEALRLQVHVGSFKDPECQKIVPNVKRLLPSTDKRSALLVKLQCVKSGNITSTLEAAYVEIFQESTGFAGLNAETPLEEAKTYMGSLEPRALEAIDAEVVVETGIHAAFNNVLPVAAACDVVLQRKGKNMPPKTRVLCQVLNAILLIAMPSTHTDGKLSSRQRESMLLSRRVEGTKAFERALLASKRQQDPQLVERVCIYAWNLSLPLLQPHMRNNLTRVFSLASSIMEELDSLLLGFRARLYLEIAKLEVASDFLAKANANVCKALALDYGTISRANDTSAMTVGILSAHEEWIIRPVDTHLLPIKQKLDLKLAVEESSSRSVEVLAMLEQVKEGKDPQQQRSTLTRFAELKSRVQIAQNAKDITPTDSTTAPLKIVAYLEAMEVTFKQMLLPAAQQPQLLEKAQGFYQKAITMWQTTASETFTSFMSNEPERGLEEEQQLMELYVEIWVRIGCGAFRLKNTKLAIDCAEEALLALKSSEDKKSKQMTQLLFVGSTWKWLALAELLFGRSILALGQGDIPAQKLVLASLLHLVRAIEYGLQATYERENPDSANRVDYDAWKQDKTPKHVTPVSERDWINFFMDHDENAANRFYMPWVLQSNTVHITQPVLTLLCLEDLLAMLREDGLQYSSMIPSFCLYTVLFHAYIPQQTCIAQIWMELSQFDLMERLNLSNFSLPLHNALDMIQSNGDALIKELQEAQASTELPEGDFVSRKRHVFHSTHLDTREKAVKSIQLLLRFGFVRQAKTLLEVLRCSAESSSNSSNFLTSACEVLSSRVLEIEGQYERALSRANSALRISQLDICRFLEWTLRCCKLNPDLDESLSVLKNAEKQAARTVVAGMRRPVGHSSSYKDAAPSSSPEVGMVQLMARVIFKQAMILLKKAGVSKVSSILDHLQESRRTLEKTMRLLTHIDAHYQRSQLLIKYSAALQSFQQKYGDLELTSAGLDTKSVLQEALTLQEKCFESHFFFSSPPSQTEKHREAVVAPLGLKIALTKLQVARFLMAPELSSAAIKVKEMTWYGYYEDSQRTVVEKWLNATESVQEGNNSFQLPRAMTLITSAIDTLSDNPVLEIQHAIAQVLKLQCQRLTLFHGDDRQKADALRTHLWTRYTSSDARHATWVCCHGARAELAVAAADAAANQTAAQSQNQSQTPIQDEQETEEEEEEGVDEVRLEEMLTAHAAKVQKYQLIAFEKQCAELLRLCSNELVQVLGCRHPFDCAKNVLKHQSAEVIEVATALFEKCVSESNVQRLHLRRMKKLQKTHTSAEAHSLPFQLSQLYLTQQSESYKRMSVGTRVDAIVAALPSSIRVMCLHFSPDRCYLYAAFLGSTERRVAISRMEFTDTQAALLEQLQKRIQTWREKCAKETLAYEEAHGQDEMYEFTSAETSSVSMPVNQGEDILEDELTMIIKDTAELLNPLFAHSAMKAELKSNLTGNTLVLLLDRVFACLPMEALPVLQPADAIARDFSIQILHQRLMAMKKQPLRPNDIRVIVDPHKEDPGNSSGQTITSVVKQAAGGWKDAFEHGQIPSVTDWQQALLARRGGGLMYVGPNRVLGSYLPLQQVTGMNVALTCQAMILLDHAENSKSARRQSKVDSEKPAREKEVECDPYARALLLTLCGVNVLTINQWATTFNGNRRLANGLLQNMTRGYYVGKALKKFGEATIAPSASTSSLPVATTNATDAAAATSSPTSGSDEITGGKFRLKNRFRYNPVVYGLANLTLKSSD
ncbi:hypothetical protein PC111_g14923 [Phytophthora cactorum]|nr:hypothetical protein PC111_g14923 [Phytophthora cactorum]